MLIYALSFFLTSTAFVSTNAKIRHASFEIYRILVELSFRATPYQFSVFVFIQPSEDEASDF